MKTVAYLGPENTNTHFAAKKKFGTRCAYRHAATVEEIFQLVERAKADFGVVPIENSLEGAVTHTLDRFIDFAESPAKIYGEIVLPIQHFLIMAPGASEKRIRVVYSHPQALAQCQTWLDKHYPRASRRETGSTAEAVEKLLMQKEGIWPLQERSAVGRLELAQEHKLKATPIPLGPKNQTRFLVISLQGALRGRQNKTSLMFALKDKPGALYDALTPFKKYGINLTKIESRPSRRKAWEYVFFIDLQGHQLDERVAKAIAALKKGVTWLKVLGSYHV